MAFSVTITLESSSSTATLSGAGGSVTILDNGPQVTLAPVQSQAALNPDGSRIVYLNIGYPGPKGDSPEIVTMTLAEYLALTPEEQMDGTWYLIPKT